MAVQYLGRVQANNPLKDALSGAIEGYKMGEDIKDRRAARESASANAGIRGREADISESNLSLKLAEHEFTKQEIGRKNTYKALEQFSMFMNDKEPQEQEMFKTSDHYKELQKLVKANLPEFVNKDTGEIVVLNTKDIFAKQLGEKVAQAKMRVAQGGGSEEDINLIKLQSNDGIYTIAGAMEQASKELSPQEKKNPQSFMGKVSQILQGLVGPKTRDMMQGGEQQANPMSEQLGTGVDPKSFNANDPLGILQ